MNRTSMVVLAAGIAASPVLLAAGTTGTPVATLSRVTISPADLKCYVDPKDGPRRGAPPPPARP